MASFYAELHVAGHVYVLRTCSYGVGQATDHRGRVVGKVHPYQIDGVLDVPRDSFLESWAAAVHKPLPGHVTFFNAQGGAAFETVSWEEGHCVLYREEFDNGKRGGDDGSYLAFIAIAAPKLVMRAGGPPAPFVAQRPGSTARPNWALPGHRC